MYSLLYGGCVLSEQELSTIVDKFDDMFSSSSRRKRVWAAFKATTQSKQLQRFRESLAETKATLTLAMVHQWLVDVCAFGSVVKLTRGSVIQPPSYTISAEANIFQNLQRHPVKPRARIQAQSNLSFERPPSYRRHAPNRSHQTSRALPSLSSSNPPHALTYFPQHTLGKAHITPKLQELMHTAINQTAVAKFTPTSLETFAQDGYTLSRSGMIQAKTFVYSNHERYRVNHTASAFRTAFGCVWVRTTTIQGSSDSGDHGDEHDHSEGDEDGDVDAAAQKPQTVTSVIFYPTTWIQWLGITHGLEALMAAGCRSWLLNCRITATRAVAEDALIFELCRTGQTGAVEVLLGRGLASVVDTSPKGWKPLHVSVESSPCCPLMSERSFWLTVIVCCGRWTRRVMCSVNPRGR